MTSDPLFPEPDPANPDATIAREEIGAYYDETVATAKAALAEAQAKFNVAVADRDAWSTTGEVPRGVLDLEARGIVSRTMSAYQRVAWAAIDKPADRELHAAAEDARRRDEALRRWLTARGYEPNELALPAPSRPR